MHSPVHIAILSRFNAWQLNCKFASDFLLGPITFTPSVAMIGGTNRSRQDYAAQFNFNPPVDLYRYSESTAFDWTDWARGSA